MLCRESNINFYVADMSSHVVTTVKTLDHIGPEFNFTVKVINQLHLLKCRPWIHVFKLIIKEKCVGKVSTGNFPVSLLYLTIALPMSTKGGNKLLYLTSVETQAVSFAHFG